MPTTRPLPKPNSENLPAEMDAILESIPGAAILVEVGSGCILSGNRQMAALAGRTLLDLTELTLEALFPSFHAKNVFGETIEVGLLKPNGERTLVQVSQKLLPPMGQWALLHVSLQEQVSGAQISLSEKLHRFLSAPWPTDVAQSISQALQIAAWVCEASIAAFYQADASQPILRLACTHGDASALPQQLSLREFTSLQSAHLWTPHQRPLTSLHRLARAAGLTFVASAPVGEPNAWIGLVVISGQQATPSELALPAAQILAHSLKNNIQANQQAQKIARQVELQSKQLARQAQVHEALHDGVIYITPERKIEGMNAYAEQVLGYASREVIGQPVENVLIGSENIIHALGTSRHRGYAQESSDVDLYRRDGKSFRAGLRIQSLLVNDEITGWAILLQDLSQEEQSRIRIQQLEQRALLGEVTAIFAHEVRNPINNISTGLQLMSMNLPAEASEQEQIIRMMQDCDRLSELMKSVLAFARPQEYKLEMLAVEPFLQRLLERWHPRLARANIHHTLHCEAATPAIQADPRALEQVFTNLIHNAVQAMGENGGKLTLRVRQHFDDSGSHLVEISVADTGPGIPEELRERIFEPFFTTKSGGTGLGLAITKQIVTAHRGLIRVTSIPGGTAFQVLLPVSS